MSFKVKKNEDKPESKEILAENIVRIGEGFKKLEESGLNEHAIMVLLNNKTKVPMADIKAIFDGLRRLEGWYCR